MSAPTTTPNSLGSSRPSGSLAAVDLGLYGVTVFAWGASWIALKLQVGVVAPEISVLWRFAAGAIIMAAWLALRGKPWRFPLVAHLRFAAMGACLFCFNFLFFYYGAKSIPSGLMSVVFSTAAIVNLFLAALFLGAPLRPRTLLAAALGMAGVGCLFWPEIVGADLNWAAVGGLGYCFLGTLFFCVGNIVSLGTQARGIPVLSANAWGMAYGSAILAVLGLIRGQEFTVEPTASYLLALAYLAVIASVVAFASYLTLLGRIGAGRAGYVTVMFPLVALAISSVFEGYQWSPIAAFGAVLALSGNLLILTGPKGQPKR